MVGCLDGVRVLELARYQAGPRGGMILSDMGAEVIKIEKPGGEDTRTSSPIVNGQSIYFSVYNRGKKSICLDLRQEKGKAVFRDLVKAADFVLENFRPGTMERMGFDYASLCAIKPDIILLSVSAFGQYGPYRERPGFDPVGQAMSGLMSLTGKPVGQPIGAASSVVDRYTALHVTIGALGALRHRDLTGEGQMIDVCLLVARGVVVAPVLTPAQAARDPHVQAREMLVKMNDPVAGETLVPGLTIKFSKTPGKLGPVPLPGQHTNDVLAGLLGYTDDQIGELRACGVV